MTEGQRVGTLTVETNYTLKKLFINCNSNPSATLVPFIKKGHLGTVEI